MKHLTIELIPTDRILQVYFAGDAKGIKKIFPKMKDNLDFITHDGFYFADYDTKNQFYDVILIDNTRNSWTKASWIGKVGLITHEIIHCVYHVFDATGINGDEIGAHFVQYIQGEILRKYDFKKNRLK